MQKVQPGSKLRIRAEDYNAFIEAAKDYQARQHNVHGRSHGRDPYGTNTVLVYNASGGGLDRLSVLSAHSTLWNGEYYEDAILDRLCFYGVVPGSMGTWQNESPCILAEPIPNYQIGRAYIGGAVPVKVAYDQIDELSYPCCDYVDGQCGYLRFTIHGPFSVLIATGHPDPGYAWAYVRFGDVSRAQTVPVRLYKTGGGSGGATTQCSYVYDVYDNVYNRLLYSDVDPTARPHAWRRPSVGKMTQATAGLASLIRYDRSTYYHPPTWSIHWINEAPDND